MVKLHVRRVEGHVVRFALHGHAECGEYGYDLVCAATSALTIAAANGLFEHAGVSRAVRYRSGYLDCVILNCPSAEVRMRADAVLETMISGIRAIALEYPESVSVVDIGGSVSARY
ncbi:MAG: ribosomal-processing cysteine protease Prp [Bacillota bacterium]|nr:ribosomal-processing cysteine protease Prp [Bacillota bacterium]HOO29741.1 ribosomal-processing cysteine protease Prp [Bacillota bacterium]HPQ02182.1 ribosomal-processing cysteine protease Prp [Bacillota bacterium]